MISACLALFLALGAIAANAQQPAASPTGQNSAGQNSAEQTQEKQERQTSKPYTGDLSVFEYEGRDKKLQVDRVMDILGIAPGKAVADIGAGSGWFTIRAAKRVTQTGVVYAVDINPEAVRYIQQRTEREGFGNVKTILSKPADSLLPPQSIDAVLLLKTYHEIAEPVELLKNLRKSLRPGARVGIIDRNGTAEDHGVNEDIVVREAERAGYKLTGKYDFVKADKEDYFLVFEKK
jgi:ubiquinone/menaquinone biosynthesis C-methylase UbiE